MPMRRKPTPPDPSPPKHMAASMRVVASHLHTRHVSVDTTRDEVLQVASRIDAGIADPEIESLAARLEKVTGAASPSWRCTPSIGKRWDTEPVTAMADRSQTLAEKLMVRLLATSAVSVFVFPASSADAIGPAIPAHESVAAPGKKTVGSASRELQDEMA